MNEPSVHAVITAVESLDVASVDVETLAAVHGALETLTAKYSTMVRDLDRRGEHAQRGAASMQAFLRVELRCSDRDAQRHVDTARKLDQLPAVRDAWLNRRLSTGQIDIIARAITTKTLPIFATQDAHLVEVLAPLSIPETHVAMQRLAAAAEAVTDDGSDNTNPATTTNRLHLSKTLDGRYRLSGDLNGETGDLLATALELADSRDLAIASTQRRGDALADVAEFFLNNATNTNITEPLPGQRRPRPHLSYIIDPDGNGETEDATPIPPSLIERLRCDAKVNTVRFADGHVLYYGRDRRTASDAQYAALAIRDRGCRFPGCGRPVRWTHAHHVTEWDRDHGPTNIDTLVLLCAHHHRVIHQPDWHNELLPNGTYIVTAPDSTTRRSKPPGDPQQQTQLFPKAA